MDTIETEECIKTKPKPGILRLDVNKPRRLSGGSVEFRVQPQLLGEDTNSPSGTTPTQQLSVTWATPFNADEFITKSSKATDYIGTPINLSPTAIFSADSRNTHIEERCYDFERPTSYLNSGPRDSSDSQLPFRTLDEDLFSRHDKQEKSGKYAEDDEEDYSISVSAIMQRRASVRGYRNKRGSRNSRRASSVMEQVFDSTERRRSSIYTTSSDEGTNQESTQEQIFENIRLHKEVIQSVKLQPWPMRKKLKLVRQAKTYVARHEGALQERFAMSRSTRDLWARFKILMAARWRHWKREMASFATTLIPWELRIKEIESHFGSGVASYFTFLRWLMSVNIMIAIPLVAFVIGPEYFSTMKNETDPRKRMTDQEYKVAGNLFTIWEFEGYLKYSPMFYGYYSSISGATKRGYKLPLAYFLTSVLVYVYSFVATLKKMAENSRNSKLSSKDDECTFSWKLFTGWDFMIGHAETAHNRVASVVVGFKEALLEEAEKKKDNHNWRIILQRILVNILVVGLLAASGYTVVKLVNESGKLAMQDNWLSRNAVNVTMTLLSFFLPMIFEALGLFEKWHPRQQLRLQLARIMMLNMLNLYSLMFSFIYNITSKEIPLQELKIRNETAALEMEQLTNIIGKLKNSTTEMGSNVTTIVGALMANTSSIVLNEVGKKSETALMGAATITTSTLLGLVKRIKCYNITVKCSKPWRAGNNRRNATTALLLINLTTTTLPTLTSINRTPSTTWSTMPRMRETTTTILNNFANITSTTASTTTIMTTTPTTTTTTITTNMPENDLSTMPDNEEEQQTETEQNLTDAAYTTQTEDIESTTIFTEPTLKTTTTTANGNHSFFDYYDYFAGLPYNEREDVDLVKHKKLLTTTTQQTISDSTPFLIRKRRQATTTMPTSSIIGMRRPLYVPPFRKSSYSRRKNENSSILTNLFWSEIEQTTSSTTTATNPTMLPTWLYAQRTTDLETTTTTATITTPTETDASSTLFSETTSLLPDTSTLGNYDSTPYFIDDDNIVGIGEAIYYDKSDANMESYDTCIRRICHELPPDISTTTISSTIDGNTDSKKMVMPISTTLQTHERRLKELQLTLKEVQKNLTSMCWETTLGQELSKVIVFDGLMGILVPLCIDFLRALFVRYGNRNFCWDMEKTFPQYGDFKIAENILTLIYNQGQVWMGIFFSPGLVLINLAKLIIMMYFRSFIVLTCNVPHEVVFKASKSNNFYLTLLLTMLFLCVLPVGYAIVWLRPSWHCGPFSNYNRISEFITITMRNALPKQLHEPLDYLTSSSTVIPLLLLLILIIYYLVSLTSALREANQDLRTQLHKEREEERRKMFKVHESKEREPAATALSSRWRKVLEASSPVTPTQQPDFETEEYKSQARRELISRIMKNALRKGSATSDEDSMARHGRDDDDTDTEHHDSLPLDEEGKDMRLAVGKLSQIRRTRKPSLVDIVQIAKSERDRERAASMRIKKDNKTIADNDNDPEMNTRVVNERRQSLLHRKREEDAGKIEHKMQDMQVQQKKIVMPQQQQPQQPLGRSNFAVIDEKNIKTLSTDKNNINNKNEETTECVDNNQEQKLKLKKGKSLRLSTTSKRLSQKRDNTNKNDNLEGLDTRYVASFPTTPTPNMDNADKFATFSRLGRKKLNNFLALVKDAVNANKNENEQRAQNLLQTDANKLTNLSAITSIEIPVTTKDEIASSELMASAVASNNMEESDQPGSIEFPIQAAAQRRKVMERSTPIRQDSQASVWSDNIPTIMISRGSDECITNGKNTMELAGPTSALETSTTSAATPTTCSTTDTSTSAKIPANGHEKPVVNIIKINLEDKDE